MKFGVNLINFGPSACADSLARWAMLTERKVRRLALAIGGPTTLRIFFTRLAQPVNRRA